MSQHLLPKKLQSRLLIGVGFGVAVYFFIVLYAGFGEVSRSIEKLENALWIFPALCGLSFLNYVVRFVKWEYYRTLLDIHLPRTTSFLVYLAGFVLSVTPGKMGEVFKAYLIKKVDGTRFSRSAPIIVAERFTDLTGYLILMAIGGLTIFPQAQWIFGLTIALIAALLYLVASPNLVHRLIGLTRRRRFVWRFTEKLEHAYDSARTLLHPKHILLPTLVSVVSWGCECFGFWLLCQQIAPETGLAPTLSWATFTYAFSAIVGALVIIVPGGLGVTESSLGKLLDDKAGYTQPDAAAITLVIRACTLWFAVLCGYVALILFVRFHGRIEEDMDAMDDAETSASEGS